MPHGVFYSPSHAFDYLKIREFRCDKDLYFHRAGDTWNTITEKERDAIRFLVDVCGYGGFKDYAKEV